MKCILNDFAIVFKSVEDAYSLAESSRRRMSKIAKFQLDLTSAGIDEIGDT